LARNLPSVPVGCLGFPAELEVLQQYLQENLDKEFVSESTAGVPKKDGAYVRLCGLQRAESGHSEQPLPASDRRDNGLSERSEVVQQD
jgi:hypothetical protein